MLSPVHTGVGETVTPVGANGLAFTTKDAELADGEVQPVTVWVTLYTPAIAKVTLFLVTGLPLKVGPSGVVHVKAAPPIPVADSVISAPTHTGLGDTVTPVGADGVEVTTKLRAADEAEGQPNTVWVTV